MDEPPQPRSQGDLWRSALNAFCTTSRGELLHSKAVMSLCAAPHDLCPTSMDTSVTTLMSTQTTATTAPIAITTTTTTRTASALLQPSQPTQSLPTSAPQPSPAILPMHGSDIDSDGRGNNVVITSADATETTSSASASCQCAIGIRLLLRTQLLCIRIVNGGVGNHIWNTLDDVLKFAEFGALQFNHTDIAIATPLVSARALEALMQDVAFLRLVGAEAAASALLSALPSTAFITNVVSDLLVACVEHGPRSSAVTETYCRFKNDLSAENPGAYVATGVLQRYIKHPMRQFMKDVPTEEETINTAIDNAVQKYPDFFMRQTPCSVE
eukprot:m.265689 g.265689  ORF g.265689 m.265689 type:complete len:327 (-) comp63118_c0_seq1:51-1031(-)